MNNWNFNELTQKDVLDFKACQRTDGSIYGIPNKSDCSKGKEVTVDDQVKLAKLANKGDKKAQAKLNAVEKANKEQVKKERKEEQDKKAAAKKKKAEEEANKKGKKGKGKKGGGKGKGKGGGKGKSGGKGKGGGKAASGGSNRKAASTNPETRQRKMKRMRQTVEQLQKLMSRIKNPEQRARLQGRINDVLKSVMDMTAVDAKAAGVGAGTPAAPAGGKPAAPPAAPKQEKKEA